MSNPTTEPGLGGPAPASSGTDTVRDATPTPPPASSFDDAMRDAELRVAEAHNREIVDREAERRRVHLETTAKLRQVEKGSDAHFELLALRQKWTLPLDDDDYVLWMQHHLLEQHGKAMADEASQKRRERAKQMARGPAIGLAVVLGLATVAAIGWFLRGSAEKTRGAAATAAETAPPAAAPPSAAAPAAAETAAPASTTTPTAAATAAAPPSAPPASSAAAPGAPPKGGGAAPNPGSKPGAPKRDPWEREF
jgi:hypothetical protein